MKKMKEKKYSAPNEASLKRWIGTLLVSFLIAAIPGGILTGLFKGKPGAFMGIGYNEIYLTLSAVVLFVGLVIAIKLVGKTSVKDFVLGVGGKVNKKECLTILILYLVGFVISYLPVVGGIRLRGGNAGEFAFLVVFMLLTTWMQTTWEEFIFRGFLSRWVCGNKLCFTKKSIIAAVVTAMLFAVSHAINPEVTSQSGIRIVMAIVSYAIPGLVCFFANLYFGNLLPGIIMHAVNNFLVYTLIASEVTAMPLPTLLVDTASHTGEVMLLTTSLLYVPVVVYMILDARKKKAAAAREN